MDLNDLDSLSNLKYYDLLKIAKEKAAVKKRVSKDKLIEIIRASIMTIPENVSDNSEPETEQTNQAEEPRVEIPETDKPKRKKPLKAKRVLKGTKGRNGKNEEPATNLDSTFTLEDDAADDVPSQQMPAMSLPPATPKAAVKTESSTKIPKLARPAPNFAQLHQKNFDKMQSVDDYVERKRLRTATLTSSAKPNRVRPVLNTPSSAVKPTPMKFDFTSGLGKPVFTAKGSVAVEKKRIFATVKENMAKLESSSSKVDAAKPTSLKAISQNTTEKKRSVLKGVRTNRRFELLMKHRDTLKSAN